MAYQKAMSKPDSPEQSTANKVKNYVVNLYNQGKSLMAPENSEAESFKEKGKQIQEVTEPVAKPTAAPIVEKSPQDTIDPNARYGSRPGEKRIDTNDMTKPLGQGTPVFDEGGEVKPVDVNDGKHQMAVLEDGERVLTPEETAQYDQEHGSADEPRMVASNQPPSKPSMAPIVPKETPAEPKPYPSKVGAPEPSAKTTTSDFVPTEVPPRDMSQEGTPSQPQQQSVDDPGASVRNVFQKQKEQAAMKGDLVGLGAAIIGEKATAPKVEEQKPAVADTEIKDPKDFKAKIAQYKHAYQQALDEFTPEGQKRAAAIKEAMLNFMRENPYGSAGNHPGVLGKIEHGLAAVGNVAGAALAPGVEEMIPQSALGREKQSAAAQAMGQAASDEELKAAQAQHAGAQAKQAANNTQLAGKLLLKGYVMHENPQTGEIELGQVPGFRDAPKNAQEIYANAVANALSRNPNVDPTQDPEVQAALKGLQAGQKPAQPSAEANLEKQQATLKTLAAHGLPVDPDNLDNSLKKAVQNKWIGENDAADVQAFNAVRPTTVAGKAQVAQNAQVTKDKNKTYFYMENGVPKMAKGSQIPDLETRETEDIKDPGSLINEGRAENAVTQSLNQIAKDVHAHPEIFDNAVARNILATTLEQVDRTAASMLVAGTGGSIPLPSGLGDMINTALQNNALDKTTAQALQDYITDYRSMKDKAMVIQMGLQNGKMGRGNAQAFNAVVQQIPGGHTPNSREAMRAVDLFQRGQKQILDKFPDQFLNYEKEKQWVPTPSPKYHAFVATSKDKSKPTLYSNDNMKWYDDKGKLVIDKSK